MKIVRITRGSPARVIGGERMATLSRWDPFRELVGLQDEMTRLFSRATGSGENELVGAGSWIPPMDVLESQDHYELTLELPGVTPDQVDVTFSDGVLTIRGERKFYEGYNEESFHRIERRFGAFTRSVTLPAQVDGDRISASFANGVLRLQVPKADQAKPRRIEVKAQS